LINDSQILYGSVSYDLFEQSELDLINQYQNQRLDRLMSSPNLLPRQEAGMNNLYLANSTRDDLDAFEALLPNTFESDSDFRAAQLALLAYQSGLCVATQLGVRGFDTHQAHDDNHFEYMAKLTNLVTYIFDVAEAGGFADKVVVTMASDFGRTPYYNSGGGKDHWPIGSAIIIQQGAEWGNRVVGATDEEHQAYGINPETLQIDNNGVRLEPRHLQQAMRRLSGIDQSGIAQLFPLNAEDFDFFNPFVQTL
jgi:hypothetical protein